jgi:XTP/dITP diphosphohydrolase
MKASHKIRISYVTRNDFKIEENGLFKECVKLADNALVDQVFEFDIRRVPIKEVLEIDLVKMETAEAIEAYRQIGIPCIVEHAGLIFDGYESYPGGLTKPMWDFLGDQFVKERGRRGGEPQHARS